MHHIPVQPRSHPTTDWGWLTVTVCDVTAVMYITMYMADQRHLYRRQRLARFTCRERQTEEIRHRKSRHGQTRLTRDRNQLIQGTKQSERDVETERYTADIRELGGRGEKGSAGRGSEKTQGAVRGITWLLRTVRRPSGV